MLATDAVFLANLLADGIALELLEQPFRELMVR